MNAVLESMPRKRPHESQLATLIPEELHKAIRDYSDKSGIRIARIVADALREYLGKRHEPTGEDQGKRRPRR